MNAKGVSNELQAAFLMVKRAGGNVVCKVAELKEDELLNFIELIEQAYSVRQRTKEKPNAR